MTQTQRLCDLLAKLKARTDHAGRPKPGYKQNVASLRAEIEMLQAAQEREIGQ